MSSNSSYSKWISYFTQRSHRAAFRAAHLIPSRFLRVAAKVAIIEIIKKTPSFNKKTMARPYTSKAIANFIISSAPAFGITDLTPLKLQKLIYYCHAWCLALVGEPLLKDDIQAWPYGPVVSDIYHEFKIFGNQPVAISAKELAIENGELNMVEPLIPKEDTETASLVRTVLERYGRLTPIQLANITHQDGEPWKVIADQHPDSLPKNIVIPNELITDCFRRLLSHQ